MTRRDQIRLAKWLRKVADGHISPTMTQGLSRTAFHELGLNWFEIKETLNGDEFIPYTNRKIFNVYAGIISAALLAGDL